MWNYQAKSLDIWYVASPSGPLPSLFKLCPWGHFYAGLDLGGWANAKNQLFQNMVIYVAYQVELNEAYKKHAGKYFALTQTLTPGVGSKDRLFFLSWKLSRCIISNLWEWSIEHHASKYSALSTTPTPGLGQKVKTFFSPKVVMLHIKLKGKKCRTLCKFDLMHIPDLLGWVKTFDIEIVQISIFWLN